MVYFVVGMDYSSNFDRRLEYNMLFDSYKKVNYTFDNKIIISRPKDLYIPGIPDLDIYDTVYFERDGCMNEYSKYFNILSTINTFLYEYKSTEDIMFFIEPDMIFLPNDNTFNFSEKAQLVMDINDMFTRDIPEIKTHSIVCSIFKASEINVKYWSVYSGMMIPMSNGFRDLYRNIQVHTESILNRYKGLLKKLLYPNFCIEEACLANAIFNNEEIFEMSRYVIFYNSILDTESSGYEYYSDQKEDSLFLHYYDPETLKYIKRKNEWEID